MALGNYFLHGKPLWAFLFHLILYLNEYIYYFIHLIKYYLNVLINVFKKIKLEVLG